ncbi:MAG: SUMF1/EgtB/PvdO family nonheme iron enzyme, partial [Ramlibacter sp.]|nr:SUMF1/EgtB/PvdO family nonheme iron enzyme [Ramlibacter sp.]
MPAVSPDTFSGSIDAPSMRRAGRELLSLAMMDARNHTLHLLSHFENAIAAGSVAVPEHAELELPAWLAGHIGWMAEYWIGRNPQRGLGPACPADAARLASIEPMADRWFNPALAPHGQRWALDLPAPDTLRAYLLETLEGTMELLEKAPEDDDSLYFYRMALFHEDLRCEQLVTLAQTVGLPLKLALPGGVQPREAMLVPGGHWQLGSPPGGFVFGLEKWAHDVDVPEFEIDAQPVNWGQYLEFVDDGGYDNPGFWLPPGWDWLE